MLAHPDAGINPWNDFKAYVTVGVLLGLVLAVMYALKFVARYNQRMTRYLAKVKKSFLYDYTL
jgi:hypothetical protein